MAWRCCPQGQGCPAHAGIDPANDARRWRDLRLPRARGDRPLTLLSMPPSCPAAPRTRGSTRRTRGRRAAYWGCPAHAGIDLRCTCASPRPSGLPRARGDRPRTVSDSCSWAKAAPRTRGSTRAVQGSARLRWGCPAHAGIDPGTGIRHPRTRGLPRARGDRPPMTRSSVDNTVAAPRTRGSTDYMDREGDHLAGCPAHAGIDPLTLGCGRKISGLPRARGDRPIVWIERVVL